MRLRTNSPVTCTQRIARVLRQRIRLQRHPILPSYLQGMLRYNAFGALVVSLFLITLLLGVKAAHSIVVDRVVAIVNQEIITLSELEQINIQLQNPLFEQLSIEPSRVPKKQQLHETLRLLIEKKLQLQAAHKRGITVGREELQQALLEVRNRQGITDDIALQRLLSQGNLTISDYTQEIKDQLTILKLINREIRSGVVLQEDEINAYYNAHPEQFILPERIHLAQILLSLPQDAKDYEIRDFKEKARKIHAQLLDGGDFSFMAKSYSDGSEANQGGDLGYFKRGELLEDIDRAVFSLQEGQISDVIRSPLGFHVFKVLEKKSVEPIPYGEVKYQLEERLFLERSDMAYKTWIKRLRDQAYVEVRM